MDGYNVDIKKKKGRKLFLFFSFFFLNVARRSENCGELYGLVLSRSGRGE